MGKKAKEHRKRVAARNERIRVEKKKVEKMQMDFLMKLIEAEKQKGAFNGPVQPMPGFEGPNLGLPTQETSIPENTQVSGPQI